MGESFLFSNSADFDSFYNIRSNGASSRGPYWLSVNSWKQYSFSNPIAYINHGGPGPNYVDYSKLVIVSCINILIPRGIYETDTYIQAFVKLHIDEVYEMPIKDRTYRIRFSSYQWGSTVASSSVGTYIGCSVLHETYFSSVQTFIT